MRGDVLEVEDFVAAEGNRWLIWQTLYREYEVQSETFSSLQMIEAESIMDR